METILPTGQTQPAAAALIKDSSTAAFKADVIDASNDVTVLVDFWAPWCGPCKQLTPALEKVVSESGGKVKLVKINVDENQELSGQLGVRSIPTVFAFSGGQPVDGFMGALPESELRRFVEKVTGGQPEEAPGGDFDAQVKAALDTADQALVQGQPEQAAQVYQMILQQLPDNEDALLGLANVFVQSGQIDEARELLGSVSEEAQKSERYVAAIRAIELAGEVARLGDPAALETRLATDPADHQARIDLAMIMSARGERVEVAELLTRGIKIDREWNEGAMRAKLIELFEAWGPADPATARGRRMLSSVLFS